MQTDHKTNGGRGASLSRRKFFQIAVASTAAALPAAAHAEGSADLQTLPLTNEQQLEACIGQLRNILQRMHPESTIHHPHWLSSREDGSYRLSIQGDVTFQEFSGNGLYEISLDGIIMQFWLEGVWRRSFYRAPAMA